MDALGKENDMLQAMNKMFGEKLGTHIEQLSTEILVADRLPDDEKMFLALAGMKEIKDILRGYIQSELMAGGGVDADPGYEWEAGPAGRGLESV